MPTNENIQFHIFIICFCIYPSKHHVTVLIYTRRSGAMVARSAQHRREAARACFCCDQYTATRKRGWTFFPFFLKRCMDVWQWWWWWWWNNFCVYTESYNLSLLTTYDGGIAIYTKLHDLIHTHTIQRYKHARRTTHSLVHG